MSLQEDTAKNLLQLRLVHTAESQPVILQLGVNKIIGFLFPLTIIRGLKSSNLGKNILIQNFMIVTEGPQIPAGEVYFEAENPKGALGFFIVSKGGGVPYRLKIRGPSFCNLSILDKLIPGHYLTDITVILGSLDFVMGECDR